MRSLLYIVICTVGLVWLAPALANKAQSPNQMALSLDPTVSPDERLTLTTSLNTIGEFYKGSADLMITRVGWPGSQPIEVFAGTGGKGFDQTFETQLPKLLPGRYRIHGVFTTYRNAADKVGIRAGTNLYIDVRSDKVLSSTVSFDQIYRHELKAKLLAREKKGLANSPEQLKQQAPELYQKIEAANRVPALQSNGVETISADADSLARRGKSRPSMVQVIELSQGVMATPDPRKKPKRRRSGIDKENAILEKQEYQD